MYDLVVIGAGSGGLTAVKFAAQLGAKVALIEKHRIGGDCTWTGCIPSKALLHVARTVHGAKQAANFGVTTVSNVDMSQVKAYVQETIDDVYALETAEKIAEQGVDVIMGGARFIDPQHVQVDDQVLGAKKFLLTTGAHPFVPPIPGLEDAPYLTYDQIFENERSPDHLIVLGAGPIGMEISQAYSRLGARVTIVDKALLPREEPEVGQLMAQVIEREGVKWVQGLATVVTHIDHQFHITVHDKDTDNTNQLTGDMLLVAVGRRPNVLGLGLENVGVAYSEKGIQVNDKLQTTAGHIYAAGDSIGGPQFTHYAGWQAFKAVRNALLPGSDEGVAPSLSWVTFTDPEVAHTGLTEQEARRQYGDDVRVIYHDIKQDDRAQTDDVQAGFVKIVGRRRDGRVAGATIVAPRAGEMIIEFVLAITHNLSLHDLAETIHPYPTYNLSLQLLAADQATEAFLASLAGKFSRWWVHRS